jgi:hypothetical protein
MMLSRRQPTIEHLLGAMRFAPRGLLLWTPKPAIRRGDAKRPTLIPKRERSDAAQRRSGSLARSAAIIPKCLATRQNLSLRNTGFERIARAKVRHGDDTAKWIAPAWCILWRSYSEESGRTVHHPVRRFRTNGTRARGPLNPQKSFGRMSQAVSVCRPFTPSELDG